MQSTAVLLIDLQVDFLDSKQGRMPVGDEGAGLVIAAAQLVISGRVLPDSQLVAVVNAFPRSHLISNFFRRHAAIAGSKGAKVDPRVHLSPETPVFSKSKSDAFTNPDLHSYLQAKDISRIILIGVFAEACIRATALKAKMLGYDVIVPLDAIATNASWKLAIGKYLMGRAGIVFPPELSKLI